MSGANLNNEQEKQALVTVVISCYNHAPYIRQSIDSVLNQTYKSIQLLVFDDGSTDDSVAVIESLRKDRDFFFCAQNNQGLTATLNNALSMANGRYYIPFGSDDIMMPDRIERQVAYMKAHPDLGMCGGNVLNIDVGSMVLDRPKINPPAIQEFKHVLLNLGPGAPAPTLFFRVDVLREIGGFDTNIRLEDLHIKLLLTYRGYKIGIMNDVLAYYRLHPSNTYKNLRFMVSNVLATYDCFRDSEYYETAKFHYLNGMLLRASKRDRAFARELIRMIPMRHYNWKTIRALPRLLLK